MYNAVINLISILMYIFQGYCIQYLFSSFLKVKHEKYETLDKHFIGVMWIFIKMISFYAFPAQMKSEHFIVDVIISIAFVFIFSLIWYKGFKSIKLFLTIIFITICELISFIAHFILVCIGNLYGKMIGKAFESGKIPSLKACITATNIGMAMIQLFITIVFGALLYFTIKSITKNYFYKNHSLCKKELLFILCPSVVSLLISVLIKIIMINVYGETNTLLYDKNSMVFVLVPSISVVSLCSIIFGINLFQNVIRLNEEKRNRIIIEKQITNMQEHIKEIDSLYDSIRGMKHDMKNSIFVMKQLMEKMGLDLSDNTLEINKYLLGMEQTINKLDFKFLTGNPVTDVVINGKYLEASSQIEGLEIELDGFILPNDLQISVFDIGVILINALDNAIEACWKMKQKQPKAKTFIHLKSFKRGKLFFIEVDNSFDGEINFDEFSDLPVTSKNEKDLHGIGLKNIRNSARKYYGDVDCMVNDKTFSLSVMLKENK